MADFSTPNVTEWLTRNGLEVLVERFAGECMLLIKAKQSSLCAQLKY